MIVYGILTLGLIGESWQVCLVAADAMFQSDVTAAKQTCHDSPIKPSDQICHSYLGHEL